MKDEVMTAHTCHATEVLKILRRKLFRGVLGDVNEAEHILSLVAGLKAKVAELEEDIQTAIGIMKLADGKIGEYRTALEANE